MRRDYQVTYEASWTDAAGTLWRTGRQQKMVLAESRSAAVLSVRACWPEGATGECRAEPVSHTLILRLQHNAAHGLPPSTWDENFPADLMDAEVYAVPI
jgi:hypothetical protein